MKLLYVVQRYGREIPGGAEAACREFATRMGARGHSVEVLTTCALSYADWANVYEPGTTELDGVTVHRLETALARDDRLYEPLYKRVIWGRKPNPLYLQWEWLRSQGPYVPELSIWLEKNSQQFDLVVFFTYLYYTTIQGLETTFGRRPTVLHPTIHDEPAIYLPLFDHAMRLPTAFAFFSPEEAALTIDRFRIRQPSSTIGIGADIEPPPDEMIFRRAFALGDDPYLIYVGRIDPHKGAHELFDFFVTYKKRHPGRLRLVFLGDRVLDVPESPDVIVTGFVDEEMKRSAISGTMLLVQPSYFESFSLVLTEAWAYRKPVLVQGRCAVLNGQVRRAGGGIPYKSYAEFEAALELFEEDESLRRRLGEAGHAYVKDQYAWNRVLDDYEALLDLVSNQAPAGDQ